MRSWEVFDGNISANAKSRNNTTSSVMGLTIGEFFVSLLTGTRNGEFSIYVVLLCYFWGIWGIKFILSYLVYFPVIGWAGDHSVSVIVPTYKEDQETLQKAVERILHKSNTTVKEVIIVTDVREANTMNKWSREEWANNPRVHVVTSDIGKRKAVRLGIESAKEDILVIIESDTFAEPGSIDELVKPIALNETVGGSVGDQLIYDHTANSINYFNHLVELIKYRFTIPALSVFNSVTVLGGRCVAFRKCAIAPLMDSLENETFLGKKCVSGDDGRVTSLLLATGWNCVYQRTAVFLTISPPTLKIFMKQRMRWARNSCRRTIRAIFVVPEKDLDVPYSRFWAYKRPAALLQVLTVWVNTAVMTAVVGLTLYSLVTGKWFWTGKGGTEVTIRVVLLLFVGMALRRLIRIFPAVRETPCKYFGWLLLFPWYLFLMWGVRMYSIVTMNKQGWVTRVGTGAGGFGTVGEGEESKAVGEDEESGGEIHKKADMGSPTD
ncbi:glycosyl transferase [Ectocarpus siliculosus]|uniref:Glycosyl transferase n=1 Tax=Ectocarpus siliculosus TaxID=2880 RepID=D7G7X6_ECTSI|nr:glycosyl transferase [Ectocarpus siliculosus]|eukprot:CBJ27851.1 glycosyl transferase [Ectocarpus siliculosus]